MVVMQISWDMISALWIKLKCFGIPITGPTDMYCDNNTVMQNMSIPESTLANKHSAINYLIIQEAFAAKSKLHKRKIRLQANIDVIPFNPPDPDKLNKLKEKMFDLDNKILQAEYEHRMEAYGERVQKHIVNCQKAFAIIIGPCTQ